MVWSGILAVFAGAILAFAIGRDVGNVDLTVVGGLAMILGAVLLIVGILRLNRDRRRVRLPARQRDYKTSTGKIAAMIATVVYIVSPLDLIPDVLLPVGIVDDATAFAWLVFAIGQEITRHSRKKRQAH